MKASLYYLSILLVVVFASLSGCKSDEPAPSQAQKITKLLTSGSWSIEDVTVNNLSHNEFFPDLELTFTSSGFAAVNGGAVWPSSGTWKFTDKSATTFTRNDGVEVAIVEISDNQLILSLVWTETTLGSGRMKSISGENVFTFTR